MTMTSEHIQTEATLSNISASGYLCPTTDDYLIPLSDDVNNSSYLHVLVDSSAHALSNNICTASSMVRFFSS